MNPTYRITSPLELFNKIHILFAQIHLNVRMSIDSSISRTFSFAKILRKHIESTCIFLQRRTYQWKNLRRDRSYRSFIDTQIIKIRRQDTHSPSLFLYNYYSERTQVLSNQLFLRVVLDFFSYRIAFLFVDRSIFFYVESSSRHRRLSVDNTLVVHETLSTQQEK